MTKKVVNPVIYDSTNKLVWVQTERSKKTGNIDQKYYGKSARRFEDNRQARAYAMKLAKERGDKAVYDKYYGEEIKLKKKTATTSRRQSNNPFGFNFGW